MWARLWAQSILGTCPSSAPPWVDAGEEVLRWSGREERTYFYPEPEAKGPTSNTNKQEHTKENDKKTKQNKEAE